MSSQAVVSDRVLFNQLIVVAVLILVPAMATAAPMLGVLRLHAYSHINS